MKPADDREEILFREALRRAGGPERLAFLDGACAGNEVLRGRLEARLQAHESPDSFRDSHPGDLRGQTIPLPGPDFGVELTGPSRRTASGWPRAAMVRRR